jgi:homeobox protein cut-like
LESVPSNLPPLGLELVENQKEGVVGRKALADKTKSCRPFCYFRTLCPHFRTDFKKIPDEEKANAFKGLFN